MVVVPALGLVGDVLTAYVRVVAFVQQVVMLGVVWKCLCPACRGNSLGGFGESNVLCSGERV